MTAVATLAQGWVFEIDTGTTTPTWTEIKGLNTFSISFEKNDADTTTFASQGWNEHLVSSRSGEITLDGLFLEDASGTRDPGQSAVEALSLLIGAASVESFQATSPGGSVMSFSASATIEGPGGGNDDSATWSCTLTISGKPTWA